GLRIEIDERNEKIGYKIREAQLEKVPYMLVVGDKEVENQSIGVRSRKDGDIGTMSIDKFTEKIQEEVKSYKI
ncbi:MAG: threonine--tRNA ligase, partial [Clostridia bacterium]|nr:threonine--tRNA ligase [Clostridia bacterium]